jgi:hypothetical protein
MPGVLYIDLVGGTLTQALCEHSTRAARIGIIFEERDESKRVMEPNPYKQKLDDTRDENKQAARQLDTLIGLSEMLGEALSNAFAKDHGRRRA